MYKIFTANKKTEKILLEYISQRQDIKNKKEKWACWLGSNIRAIYSINDKEEMIIIEAVGTHKIY